MQSNTIAPKTISLNPLESGHAFRAAAAVLGSVRSSKSLNPLESGHAFRGHDGKGEQSMTMKS